MKQLRMASHLAFIGAVLAIVCLACLFLYRYDNKYMAPGPRGVSGVLVLDKPEQHLVSFLVNGWEYYGGRLLSPEDFTESAFPPDEYIYIGQYGGFEAGDFSASPHGSASYRLNIVIPDEPRAYMLELPEIYSAYRLYINGRLAASMGEPDPEKYKPATGNQTVSIEAGGNIEILLAVSDYSHMYSGMVYPPAFGQPKAVSALLSARTIFRSILTSFALSIGALSLLVGILSKKNRIAMLYSLLCLFFIGYTSYPIVRSLFVGMYPFYAVENFSYCAMLTVIILLQRQVFETGKRWNRRLAGYGLFMCAASVALPILLTTGSLVVMGAYSILITAYEWLMAVYLTVTAVQALFRDKPYSKTLMGGILVLDAALVMDRLLPLHEPIVTGWFPELASFALVLCVGAVVGMEVAAKYRDNAVLMERSASMERLSQMHRANYDLLMGRVEEIKTSHHDFRHHMVMIRNLLENRDLDKLESYLSEIESTVRKVQPVSTSQNVVAGVLTGHYIQLAEKSGIDMRTKLEIGCDINISDADLCAILSNLLENAIEACQRQSDKKRFISLSIGQTGSILSIRMENSTDGMIRERYGAFLSSKAEGRKGYGLESVRAAAKRYGGDARFVYDNEKMVFCSSVLLSCGSDHTDKAVNSQSKFHRGRGGGS